MRDFKDEIIEQLLLEVCAHSKVIDGIVNFGLQEHVDALIDVLKRTSMPVDVLKEVTNSLNDGKYPDRQAYNREGFLVTFPTPEYKKQALSSGDYTNQDPTAGKGGMHLVKKVEPVNEPQHQSKPVDTVQKTQPQKSPEHSKPSVTTTSSTPSPTQPTTPKPSAPTPVAPTHKPSNDGPQKTQGGATQYTTGIPVDPSTDLNLDKISDYRDPSLEWSHNKKWQRRENNNYYDAEGNLKAVTGLDGTVVPVTEEERVDLKKFIDDKKKEKLGIQPTDTPTKS